jgi:hypothetical protein
MKYIHAFASAIICAMLLNFAASASAQTTKAGYATIVRIQGEARYSSDGKNWQPLVAGKVLGQGDVVQSGIDSTVDIVLNDREGQVSIQPTVKMLPDANVRGLASSRSMTEQNVIRLQSDTVLAIDKLTVTDTGVDTVTDTELDLRQGKIFGNVKKLSAASQYLVKMPDGVAGVRGTTFVLGADGDITVIAGSVVMSHVGPNGQVTTQVLGPGDEFNPRTGQVNHLTPAELRRELRDAIAIITVIRGTIWFPNDRTILYISPTQGRR